MRNFTGFRWGLGLLSYQRRRHYLRYSSQAISRRLSLVSKVIWTWRVRSPYTSRSKMVAGTNLASSKGLSPPASSGLDTNETGGLLDRSAFQEVLRDSFDLLYTKAKFSNRDRSHERGRRITYHVYPCRPHRANWSFISRRVNDYMGHIFIRRNIGFVLCFNGRRRHFCYKDNQVIS